MRRKTAFESYRVGERAIVIGGERPKDLESRLNFERGLGRLAVRDPAVFELLTEVRHLLKPPGLLNDPSIVSRIEEEIPPASELLFSSGVEHEYR